MKWKLFLSPGIMAGKQSLESVARKKYIPFEGPRQTPLQKCKSMAVRPYHIDRSARTGLYGKESGLMARNRRRALRQRIDRRVRDRLTPQR